MDRKTKEYMDSMSLDVFGSSSRWKKILEKGIVQPTFRDVAVPNPETKRIEMKRFQTHFLVKNRPTFDELKQFLEGEMEKRRLAREVLKKIPDGQIVSGDSLTLSDGTQAEVV